MAYTRSHRLTQLTKAAFKNKPVRITYDAVSPCPGIEGRERVIEIRRIHSSKDGNVIIRAWCRMCVKEESFRLDRIVSHRSLRGAPTDTAKPVTAYMSAQRGRIPAEDLAAVYAPQPTANGLLRAAIGRITAADRFRDVFGNPESYPRRVIQHHSNDFLREARENIRVADEFRALTADLDHTMTPEVHA